MALLITEEERVADYRSYVNEPRRTIILEQERDKPGTGGAVMLVTLLLILAIGTVYFLWEASNAEASANKVSAATIAQSTVHSDN